MDLPADHSGAFDPTPVYSEAGDCVFAHFEEAESYGDRVDGVLTVYRALDDDRVTGCQIKAVSALLSHFGEFNVEYRDGRVSLAIVFLVSNLVGRDAAYSDTERRAVYADLARRVGRLEIRVPT